MKEFSINQENKRNILLRMLLLLFICLAFTTNAQEKKEKKKKFEAQNNYFGISASPLIPSNFISNRDTKFQDSSGIMLCNFRQEWGYTFGGTARFGVTDKISIETGIHQVRRYFTASAAIPDSNINQSQSISFSNYDVPVNVLFYVQLSEKWFINGFGGFSINQFPYDSGDTVLPSNTEKISFLALRVNRTYFSFNAGTGFEYRTKKAGTFYLGLAAKIPARPIFFGYAAYQKVGFGKKTIAFEPVSSPYFTLDFKYFIPTSKKRNEQKVKIIS